jgi:hypothetical protein
MTKKSLMTTIIVATALSALVAGCSDNSTSPPNPTENQENILSAEEIKAGRSSTPVGSPGEEEITDLNFMREEEKLAHDVYTVLYDQYGQKIFSNISDSEQKHAAAIKLLLDRFGLDDPVGNNGLGGFSNEDLQTLYHDLIESGSQSLADALLVGLAIEEIDILDLEEAIGRTELRPILRVYENLLQGSHNHLRAFVSVYESLTGEVYAPRWLTQETYNEILGEDPGQGQRLGGRGGGSR